MTMRQRQLAIHLADFHLKHGYAPTLREMADAVGLQSIGSVHRHLTVMRKLGIVDWVDGDNRTIHLVVNR